MTPKEKAKELYMKYFRLWPSYGGHELHKYQCQQAAIIAVDEVMKVAVCYNDTQTENIYWKQVKQEIEKL